jgi:glycosyltransferase involved in cell wall biosynthesis
MNSGYVSSRRHFRRLHVTASLDRLGGLENLVNLMVRRDPESGVISLLDLHTSAAVHDPRVFRLRPSRWTNALAVRRHLMAQGISADTIIFHNYAGMTLLAGLIPHQRGVLYLHTNSADVFELLPQRTGFLDAILTSGSDLAGELKKNSAVSQPVVPLEYPLGESFFRTPPQTHSGELVLGFSGRLDTVQKQVGRLVPLCSELAAQGVRYRLEIAGTGPEESALRRKLAVHPVRFLGRLDEPAMSAAYAGWDLLVCTSDYETGPLVALEAMAAGVPVVMPDIPCQATALLRQIPLPFYPVGDMAAAARLIESLAGQCREEAWRNQFRRLVSDRQPGTFMRQLLTDLQAIETAPRRSRPMTPRWHPGDCLPFSFRSRLPGKETFLK